MDSRSVQQAITSDDDTITHKVHRLLRITQVTWCELPRWPMDPKERWTSLGPVAPSKELEDSRNRFLL